MRYCSSAENVLTDQACRIDVSKVGLSFGNVIIFCGSLSWSFFSTFTLIDAFNIDATVPIFSLFFFTTTSSSSSSSSHCIASLTFLATALAFCCCGVLFHQLTEIFGRDGSHTFHAQNIHINNHTAIMTTIILIAPELASPNMFCRIHSNGQDKYHQYFRHCTLSKSAHSFVSNGKFKNAETSIAAKIPCLNVVFIMPSLNNNPTHDRILIAKSVCIPCAPIITANIFFATFRIGDHCVKNSAKKYTPHNIIKRIAIWFFVSDMVRRVFLFLLLATVFTFYHINEQIMIYVFILLLQLIVMIVFV